MADAVGLELLHRRPHPLGAGAGGLAGVDRGLEAALPRVLADEQIEQAFRWAREATFVKPAAA